MFNPTDFHDRKFFTFKHNIVADDSPTSSPDGKFPVGLVAGLVVAIGSFIIILLAIKLYYYRKNGCKVVDETVITLFSLAIPGTRALSFLETSGVDGLEVIGRGGCGEVYKAELPDSSGTGKITVAIKKIVQSERQGGVPSSKMRQIKAEIVTVGRMRHRNVLPPAAHVSRPDCHYIVYEYMKNGSLQDVLRDMAEGRRELAWPARYGIALSIANGLEYLHFTHQPRVIHRDLKPANILLDGNMNARIADFGLAKLLPGGQYATLAGSIRRVAGTLGYIAPEYFYKLWFSDKCDVYSFGVIMAVLVTRKFPGDRFFETKEEMCIVRWLRRVVASEDPAEAIDGRLKGNGFEEQMVLVLKIACFCTYDDPDERPSSRDVRRMLSQIIHRGFCFGYMGCTHVPKSLPLD